MGFSEKLGENDNGFTDFVNEVIAAGGLDGAALGIAKVVANKGQEALSDKQKYVFKTQVLDNYTVDECKRCSNEIPWMEMFEASDNGGYCSWCAHMMAKDD